MAANLTDSIMYKYFAKVGCTFGEHKAIAKDLGYAEHTNGSQLVISTSQTADGQKPLGIRRCVVLTMMRRKAFLSGSYTWTFVGRQSPSIRPICDQCGSGTTTYRTTSLMAHGYRMYRME